MNSKQFLEREIRIAQDLLAHHAELQYLNEVKTATGAIRYDTDKVIHSVTEARYERPVIKLADLEEEVKQEIRVLLDQHKKVRDVIKKIEDTDIRNVLRMRNLGGLDIDIIAYRLNVSRRTITRRLELGYVIVAKITGYPAPVRNRLPAEERHGDAKRIMREYYENKEE